MAFDTARKLVFAGVAVNSIAVVFPGVGTIVLFQRFQSVLTLLGFDVSFSWVVVVALFATYLAFGMITPIVAVQRPPARHWYAAPLIVLIGGAMTVLSLGGVLLVLAGVLIICAGPAEMYWLSHSPEADVADALEDQRSPPRPATTCPICGATRRGGDTACPACRRRATVRA